MPAPAAVVASSTIFAAAHFAPRDFPGLLALGLVLGFSYVRTRNLLTPMLVRRRAGCSLPLPATRRAQGAEPLCVRARAPQIHSLWNSGVLSVLALLSSQGADLDVLLQ